MISGLDKAARQAVVVNLESVVIDLNATAKTGIIANAVALEMIVVITIFCLDVCGRIWRVIVGLVDCSEFF
ncbi:MAG: hypothetical protein ACKO8F_05765, partial [Acidimicrobiaceae bacterium]